MRTDLLAPLALVACTTAAADPGTTLDTNITAWADSAKWTLTKQTTCAGMEERFFGATTSTCWSAKSRVEQAPKGSRMFPRVAITVASYADEAKAKERMTHFTSTPHGVTGEMDKAYPLRAGFRLGARVVVVTSDAFGFWRDLKDVAIALAKLSAGSDLVCWGGC